MPLGTGSGSAGNDLYTWCGFDALFVPIILGDRAEVVSSCPVTGTEIRLTVEPDGTVSAARPGSVVVGIVSEQVLSCTIAGLGGTCAQMPLFASLEAGQRWLDDHPGVAVVDLDQARTVARSYVVKEATT